MPSSPIVSTPVTMNATEFSREFGDHLKQLADGKSDSSAENLIEKLVSLAGENSQFSSDVSKLVSENALKSSRPEFIVLIDKIVTSSPSVFCETFSSLLEDIFCVTFRSDSEKSLKAKLVDLFASWHKNDTFPKSVLASIRKELLGDAAAFDLELPKIRTSPVKVSGQKRKRKEKERCRDMPIPRDNRLMSLLNADLSQWEKRHSSHAGRSYYHNPKTDESFWDFLFDESLLKTWTRYFSDKLDKYYYFNSKSGERVWDQPPKRISSSTSSNSKSRRLAQSPVSDQGCFTMYSTPSQAAGVSGFPLGAGMGMPPGCSSPRPNFPVLSSSGSSETMLSVLQNVMTTMRNQRVIWQYKDGTSWVDMDEETCNSLEIAYKNSTRHVMRNKDSLRYQFDLFEMTMTHSQSPYCWDIRRVDGSNVSEGHKEAEAEISRQAARRTIEEIREIRKNAGGLLTKIGKTVDSHSQRDRSLFPRLYSLCARLAEMRDTLTGESRRVHKDVVAALGEQVVRARANITVHQRRKLEEVFKIKIPHGKDQVCRFYCAGNCKYRDSCLQIHDGKIKPPQNILQILSSIQKQFCFVDESLDKSQPGQDNVGIVFNHLFTSASRLDALCIPLSNDSQRRMHRGVVRKFGAVVGAHYDKLSARQKQELAQLPLYAALDQVLSPENDSEDESVPLHIPKMPESSCSNRGASRGSSRGSSRGASRGRGSQRARRGGRGRARGHMQWSR
eukprot:182830_1